VTSRAKLSKARLFLIFARRSDLSPEKLQLLFSSTKTRKPRLFKLLFLKDDVTNSRRKRKILKIAPATEFSI
jgi:hypothetical protein